MKTNTTKPGSSRHLRQQRAERNALIAVLGWKPEILSPTERYAATTGELVQWVREDLGIDVVKSISRAAAEVL